ncbi:MAG: hypothetical protein Kow00129_15720 [Thermoleophilia bacterium]
MNEPKDSIEPNEDNQDSSPRTQTQPKPLSDDPSESPEAAVATARPSSFEDFSLAEPVAKAIAKMGFAEPTPIQKKALPLVLAGKDILGQAQTGTGKTAAFGIPMAHKLPTEGSVRALVLCPTRELAVQVAEEIHEITLFSGHRVLPVYGGQRIDRQINALKKGVQIVVGTPGRILDHLGRGTLKLDQLEMLVLDEADMMLDMGFLPDIRRIIRQCPEKRQTLLFSATIPDEIRRISDHYMREPDFLSVVPETLTLDETEQIFYEVPEEEKLDALMRILDYEDEGESAIIFCRTRRNVDKLTRKLKSRGYDVDGLHGDLTQGQRDRIMQGFREGKFPYLVATDVASRGLDISHVTHVINYHIPQDPEAYVHRIGRTGRMGRSGVAITLVTPAEYWDLLRIQEFSQAQIEQGELPGHMPSPNEVEERRRAAKGDEGAKERVRRADEGARIRAAEADGSEAAVEEQEPAEVSAGAPAERRPSRRAARKRSREKARPAESGSFFAELLDMTEGPTTEAERHQRRHTLRDIEKRIEVTDVEEILEEAQRLEHEEQIQAAHRDAVREEAGYEAAEEAEEETDRRRRQEQERRRDVEERIRVAAELLAVKAEAQPAAAVPTERAAPAEVGMELRGTRAAEEEPAREPVPVSEAQVAAGAGASTSALALGADEEERIRRALELRDIVSTLVRRSEADELGDYRAVVDRVAADADLREIASVLLREYDRLRRQPGLRAQSAPPGPGQEGAGGDGDGMTRLFVSIGRRARIDRRQLEQLVRESAGLSESDIGRIDLLHNFAFIEVKKTVAGQVIESMHESVFRGREISVEPAKSRPPEDSQ